MATFTAERGKSAFPVGGPGDAMNIKVATGTYEIAANPADNDIYQMCTVPENAVVFMGWVYGDDLDTGTETLDIDVGWASNGVDAADPDGFGNLGVWTGDAVTGIKPEAGIYYPFAGVLYTGGPKKFGAKTTIQLEANAAAAAGGTGTITISVLYFIDPNY